MAIIQSTTITTVDILFTRGDTIRYGDQPMQRVIRQNGPTLTVRPCHRWRWLESLRYAWERYVAWPVGDMLRSQ